MFNGGKINIQIFRTINREVIESVILHNLDLRFRVQSVQFNNFVKFTNYETGLIQL